MWHKAKAALRRRLPAAHFRRQQKTSEDMRKILEDIRGERRRYPGLR